MKIKRFTAPDMREAIRLVREEQGPDAFPGNGRLPAHEEEVRRLRAEVKRLLMEREILKKVAAFFAREAM